MELKRIELSDQDIELLITALKHEDEREVDGLESVKDDSISLGWLPSYVGQTRDNIARLIDMLTNLKNN